MATDYIKFHMNLSLRSLEKLFPNISDGKDYNGWTYHLDKKKAKAYWVVMVSQIHTFRMFIEEYLVAAKCPRKTKNGPVIYTSGKSKLGKDVSDSLQLCYYQKDKNSGKYTLGEILWPPKSWKEEKQKVENQFNTMVKNKVKEYSSYLTLYNRARAIYIEFGKKSADKLADLIYGKMLKLM